MEDRAGGSPENTTEGILSSLNNEGSAVGIKVMTETGLQVKLFAASETEEAAIVLHRDGFVCIRDALTPEQLAFAQQGAQRVITEQLAAVGLENMNRGYARHSFGDQIHHPEW